LSNQILYTAITMLEQTICTEQDIQQARLMLLQKEAEIIHGTMYVTPTGITQVPNKPKPTLQQQAKALLKKKKWKPADRKAALAFFKPGALPPGLINFLRQNELI
jgi:hypothetical protein